MRQYILAVFLMHKWIKVLPEANLPCIHYTTKLLLRLAHTFCVREDP